MRLPPERQGLEPAEKIGRQNRLPRRRADVRMHAVQPGCSGPRDAVDRLRVAARAGPNAASDALNSNDAATGTPRNTLLPRSTTKPPTLACRKALQSKQAARASLPRVQMHTRGAPKPNQSLATVNG